MASILITGGTGYFGRAFVRHLLAGQSYERICIYSRDEAKQASMRAHFDDDERLRWFIGDVRDGARLRRALQHVDDVVHAAALKRVEVGEYNPTEMVKTNVLGAMNLIQAAENARVRVVIALSTDKACAPLNTYGASKLMAEKLFLAANDTVDHTRGPRFAVTRYGNVAGSTGSVIPTWRAALAQYGGVNVTDMDCTRFWMGIDEAVAMVRWALESVNGGELIVPNLPAYRLGDLASAMLVQHGVDSGLRPGEKLDEVMVSGDECAGFYMQHEPKYWVKGGTGWPQAHSLSGGLSSRTARRMSVDELKVMLEGVK